MDEPAPISEQTQGDRQVAIASDVDPGDLALRLLAEHLPTLCWMARGDGYITWYNRRWYDYTGTTAAEMEGWGWRSVHHPDHLPSVMERWTDSIASGAPFEMVFPLRGADGIFRPFLTRVQPYRDDAGEIVHWFGSNTDISGQVEAERAVEALEAEQEAILNQLAEGVVISDAQGHITYVNEAAGRLHGVRRLGIAPDAYSDVYQLFTEDGEPYPPHQLPLSRAVERGEIVAEARWRIRRPDGTEVIAIGNAQPLLDFGGKRAGAVLTLRDDTARHAAERSLRELNESLERRVAEGLAERKILADLVETTDAMILALDHNYTILAANKSHSDEFERIYGVRGRVGDNILELLVDQPEHQAQVREGWAPALRGEALTFVEAFGDPHRDRPYYEIKFNILRDAQGEQVGAYQFVYNVTERVRRQAELEETREALRHSQKMETVGQLTGGIAHDFNNLLTVIRSSADLLRRRDLSGDRQRRYIDAISDTADRAAKLTGQLLAFSRRQALRAEVFDVFARVEQVVEMLRPLLGPNVELVIEGGGETCFAKADPTQFEAALVNLAINARDAMDGDGLLGIRVFDVEELPATRGAQVAAGGFVAVAVADTGAGMTPEVVQRVFEPFFTTKDVGKGTGLGLSQVYGFAKQSEGEVEVASRLGEGSTFTLYLPRGEATERLGVEYRGAAARPRSHGRVLVVDDNVEVGEFASQLLADLGYETVFACDASEALVLIGDAAQPFDLVFSDVVMAGMNGVQLAKAIKGRWPQLPVVLTSGYSHIDGAQGAERYPLLKKPYSVEELSAVIRNAL